MIKEHSCPRQSFQQTPWRAELSRCGVDRRGVDAAEPPDRETKLGWRVRNILAPTDFSACSLEAVSHAAALARQYDATLTILHVIDSNPPAAFTHCGPAENLTRQLWVTGISELSRLQEALSQSMTKTRTVIVEGIPAESISENSPGFNMPGHKPAAFQTGPALFLPAYGSTCHGAGAVPGAGGRPRIGSSRPQAPIQIRVCSLTGAQPHQLQLPAGSPAYFNTFLILPAQFLITTTAGSRGRVAPRKPTPVGRRGFQFRLAFATGRGVVFPWQPKSGLLPEAGRGGTEFSGK